MISVEIDKRDMVILQKKLDALSPQKARHAWKGAMSIAANEVRNVMIKNVSGRNLKVRSGHLRRSIHYQVIERSKQLIAVIGSGVGIGERVKYANIQETGGVIRPKRGKYLTVPLDAARTRAGASRGSARDFPNTFVRNNIIYQKTGKKTIVPLFALVRSVTIKPSRYLSDTAKEVKTKVVDVMINFIKRQMVKQ
jgi:hypothetical protein